MNRATRALLIVALVPSCSMAQIFSRGPLATVDLTVPRDGPPRSAYHFVSIDEELNVPQADVYVCHPLIDQSDFESRAKPGSVALFQSTASLVGRYTTAAYWLAIEAAMQEGDFWHVDGSDSAHRLAYDSNHWYVMPSAGAGSRIASAILARTEPDWFDGTMQDEAYADPFSSYLAAWATADEWTGVPSDSIALGVAWDEMQLAFQAALREEWGSSRALICNSRGGTYALADGITIEAGGIAAITEAVALQRFSTQAELHHASEYRWSQYALNIAWNYDLDVPGVVLPGVSE